MAQVLLEFYPNGKIKTYRIRGFGLLFNDRISYDDIEGFKEKEFNKTWKDSKWE
jgi:hypothetical protein